MKDRTITVKFSPEEYRELEKYRKELIEEYPHNEKYYTLAFCVDSVIIGWSSIRRKVFQPFVKYLGDDEYESDGVDLVKSL